MRFLPHTVVEYCKSPGYTSIDLVIPDIEMELDFSDFDLHDESPQAIVLGDMDTQFIFDLLNSLFKKY